MSAGRLDIEDRALYIYTSGTTGLPKAANVSHARVMQWGHWFAGMMGAQPTDRLYNCLPMYHSVGGVLAPGAILVAGGALVIREKFSASNFWNDVIRWDCTHVPIHRRTLPLPAACRAVRKRNGHRIRMACGNGLAPEVWDRFKERFAHPPDSSNSMPPLKVAFRFSTSKASAELSAMFPPTWRIGSRLLW